MCLSIRQQIIIYLSRVVVQTCKCVSKCFRQRKCVTAPFFGHLVVIKCEYKAEMKCSWTAESSRMKSSVQLGLLCLSLFISCLHGEEVDADASMEFPINFDEPELHQFEMYRVRQQTVATEKENPAKTVAVAQPSENSKTKRKKPRPGSLSPLGDGAEAMNHIYSRTKRQDKSRNNKPKKRPGSYSILAVARPPQLPVKVKRDAE